MLPEEKDAALLWDMLKAATEIVQFVEGVKYAEFQSNKMLRYAVERQVLVIGEAAKESRRFLKIPIHKYHGRQLLDNVIYLPINTVKCL